MKAYEIIEKLFTFGSDFNYTQTCDTLKCGSPYADVTKVAVAMFPTVDLIKEAHKWGAELLIVHEPAFITIWTTIPMNWLKLKNVSFWNQRV